MKICILDGYILNPGDLSWHALERLANCEIHDRSAAQDVLERCKDAEIVMTNKVPLTRELMDELPKLEFINVMATGYNVVDTVAAKEKGIIVSNAAGYSTSSVAQHSFALLLELFSKVGVHSNDVLTKNGWTSQEDFSYSLSPLRELKGKTLGLIGYGAIGSNVAQIAMAFGMKVLVNRRNMDGNAPEGINYASLEEVAANSDAVSLHCPFTGDNSHMINEGFLKQMKNSAVLINTARGQLVNEAALALALTEGQIAGAGLDVLSQEPPAKNNPLFGCPNLILTPHQAWASFESRKRLMGIIVDNVRGFLTNDPINVVNA